MAIHERHSHADVDWLTREMLAQHGLVKMTFVQRPWTAQQRDFTVYVNKEEPVCVERAGFDLLRWHKIGETCGFSVQTLRRLAPIAVPPLEHTMETVLSFDESRTWEEFEEAGLSDWRPSPRSDLLTRAFKLCVRNGYVYASDQVSADAFAALSKIQEPE